MNADMPRKHVNVKSNYEELCRAVTEQILKFVQSFSEQKRISFVLSGGSTPKGVYRLMASSEFRDQFPWEKIHLFWGDERWVPAHHPKSNYAMAAEALISHIDIPYENIHPIKTEEHDVKTAAERYEAHLKEYFSESGLQKPEFDLMLLGLGQDGHTASLFPETKALKEKKHWVMPVEENSTEEKRITLTLPVINQSKALILLVSGREKADVVAQALNSDLKTDALPVNGIRPGKGKIYWFIDKPASAQWVFSEKGES